VEQSESGVKNRTVLFLLIVILKGVSEPAFAGPHLRPLLARMGRSAGE